MDAISNAWGLNRNLWIFIRNAVVQHQRVDPLPQRPVSTRDINVPEKVWRPALACGNQCSGEGHIDLQA